MVDENGDIMQDKPRETASSKKASEEAEEETPVLPPLQRNRTKYLENGIYFGQPTPVDYTQGLSAVEKTRLQQIPELRDLIPVNKTLPFPMFNGFRMLINGRDYKLPFNVCNPLPPGQPEPKWRKMTKNRFIGDSKTYLKRTPRLNDFQSKGVCTREGRCGDSCQNRIMLYECDETNCNIGKEFCANRAFAELAERNAAGNIGVEVFKTADKGYGVRSNRHFEPNQIITEYTGEILTEEECKRRMNGKYKNNVCYYLMSFDQKIIIDATAGSIARFVNHSCNPNCRMIKWVVSGYPRIALFVGHRPIKTGQELTYDYKFHPFSPEYVQSCLCGEPSCRGVLGPKPKEKKQKPKQDKPLGKAKGTGASKRTNLKEALEATVSKEKRKLDELVGDEKPETGAQRKRKIVSLKGKGLKTLGIIALDSGNGPGRLGEKFMKAAVTNPEPYDAPRREAMQPMAQGSREFGALAPPAPIPRPTPPSPGPMPAELYHNPPPPSLHHHPPPIAPASPQHMKIPPQHVSQQTIPLQHLRQYSAPMSAALPPPPPPRQHDQPRPSFLHDPTDGRLAKEMYGGVKYERKQSGQFQGLFVSQGTIINIDGEDYVEYRVLTKPSFF